MFVWTDPNVQEMILALENDATIFPGGFVVRLYTVNVTPTKASVPGDFTELTNVQVPGYAPVAPAWAGTPVRKPDGSWEDQGAALLHYEATGAPPAPQIVFGWYATDAAGTVLLGAGVFDVPFTFQTLGDGFDLEMVMRSLQTDGTTVTITTEMEIE